MPAKRNRIWVIPPKAEWPTNVFGECLGVPINEQKHLKQIILFTVNDDTTAAEALRQAREVVMRHNIPIRSAIAKAKRSKANAKQLLENLRAKTTA